MCSRVPLNGTPGRGRWRNATGGTDSLTAKATDSRNATATSSVITINVTTPPAPTVSIASPADGSSFAPPASIAVTVNVTPVGGATITNIELYANGALVANGANLLWNVAAAGTYALTAKAYDDHGGVGTSAPVSVSIVGDPNEKVTFIHNDFAGNPIAATDLTGAVVWKESYTPFGQRLVNATGSSSNRQWFGGKPSDSETGLSYFGARYYDPTVGRFMGIDAAGFSDRDIRSFNRFSFGNDNPTRYVDPDGNSPLDVGFLIWDLGSLGVAIYRGEGVGAELVQVGISAIGVISPIPGVGLAIKAERASHVAEVVKGASRAREVLEANKAAGLAAEDATRLVLGEKNVGEQVTIVTSTGQRTRIDFVTRSDGKLGVVESKSGGGQLSSGQAQLQKDIRNGVEVTPVGKNAERAGLTPGKPVTFDSFETSRH